MGMKDAGFVQILSESSCRGGNGSTDVTMAVRVPALGVSHAMCVSRTCGGGAHICLKRPSWNVPGYQPLCQTMVAEIARGSTWGSVTTIT